MKYIKVELNKIKYFFILLVLFTSCFKTDLSPEKFIIWVEDEDNGLSLTKEFNDVNFQILYKPINYIVAKELINGGLKKDQIQKRIIELGDMNYFTLRIKSNNSNEVLSANINEEAEYNQRLEYFMGDMQNDINLIEGTDTIPCALHHFERSYSLAPYNSFVIGFSKTKNTDADKVFVFEDRVLGTGKVMFKIKKNDINNIPNVIWN